METKEPKLVSAIVLHFSNRFLLLQRSRAESYPFKWCFPGGEIKTGEHAYDAGIRELKEETGLRLDASGQAPAPLWSGPVSDGSHLTLFTVKCGRVLDVKLSQESIGCAWFSYSDITHLDTVIPSGALEAVRTMNDVPLGARKNAPADRNELLRYLRARRGG